MIRRGLLRESGWDESRRSDRTWRPGGRGCPAVDGDDGTGEVRRIRARDEKGDARDVLRLCHPAEGDTVKEALREYVVVESVLRQSRHRESGGRLR